MKCKISKIQLSIYLKLIEAQSEFANKEIIQMIFQIILLLWKVRLAIGCYYYTNIRVPVSFFTTIVTPKYNKSDDKD